MELFSVRATAGPLQRCWEYPDSREYSSGIEYPKGNRSSRKAQIP